MKNASTSRLDFGLIGGIMKKTEKCPCKRTCVRHGDCASCRAHHAIEEKMAPACERIKLKKEKMREKKKQKLTGEKS